MDTVVTDTELVTMINYIVKSAPKTQDERYKSLLETISEAVGAYYKHEIDSIDPPRTDLPHWSIKFRPKTKLFLAELKHIITESLKIKGSFLWIEPHQWIIHTCLPGTRTLHMIKGTQVELMMWQMLHANGPVIDTRQNNAFMSIEAALTYGAIDIDNPERPSLKTWLEKTAAIYRKAGAATYNIANPT